VAGRNEHLYSRQEARFSQVAHKEIHVVGDAALCLENLGKTSTPTVLPKANERGPVARLQTMITSRVVLNTEPVAAVGDGPSGMLVLSRSCRKCGSCSSSLKAPIRYKRRQSCARHHQKSCVSDHSFHADRD
jgi:hypothetical protein